MQASSIPGRASCGCCFVIPTRMLRRLASHADPDVAAAAGRTLRITTSLNAFRSQLRTGAPVGAAVRAGLRRQVFNCNTTEDLPGDAARMEAADPVADETGGEPGLRLRRHNLAVLQGRVRP